MKLHLRATRFHLSYGITRVTFHPTQVNTPGLNPSHWQPDRRAGTRFTYVGDRICPDRLPALRRSPNPKPPLCY